MNDLTASTPWLDHYGSVPVHLDYPACTLYQMIAASAARTPAAIAWDFFDQQTSYRSALAAIDRCAEALAAEGLQRDQRLLIAMPTTPQAVIAFYAAKPAPANRSWSTSGWTRARSAKARSRCKQSVRPGVCVDQRCAFTKASKNRGERRTRKSCARLRALACGDRIQFRAVLVLDRLTWINELSQALP